MTSPAEETIATRRGDRGGPETQGRVINSGHSSAARRSAWAGGKSVNRVTHTSRGCRAEHIRRSGPGSSTRRIELRVAPENALFVEGDAPRRFEIGDDARPGGGPVVQGGDARKARFEPRHRPREGVAQPGHELK